MSDINRVTIIGRLTRDPELKVTQTGESVCSFSIASNKKWKNQQGEIKERITFVNCSAWGNTGKVIADNCKKGSRLGIDGELQSHSWDDDKGNKRSQVDIKVESFQFLDAKKQNNDDDIPL